MDGFDVIGNLLGDLVGTAAISSSGKKEDDAAGCGCFVVAVLMIVGCVLSYFYIDKPKEEPKKSTTIEAIVTGKFQNDQLGIHIRSTDTDSLITVSHDLYINKDVNDYIDIKSN